MAEAAATRQPALRGASVRHLLAQYGSIVALLLLIAFNLVVTPNFATLQTLNINLTQVCTIAIVAVGMTLVIGTGGIDLSVGSLMAISGALAPLIFMGKIVPMPSPVIGVVLGIVIPILAAGACGWFNGWLITRYRIQPIVATLILFIAGRGIAQVMTNGQLQVFNRPDFQFIGMARVFGIPFQALIMLAIVAAAAWTVRRTVFGRELLAVGGSSQAARLAGIDVTRVKRRVFVISGVCSGIAGLIVIAINSSADANQIGLLMELDAIAAVAVGGTLFTGGRVTVVGTLIGALIIQLAEFTLVANGVPDAAALVVKAGLIVVAVWLQGQRRS